MIDSMKNLLLAGLGAISYSQEKLKTTVDELIERGELTREQGQKVVDEWIDRGKDEQDNIGTRMHTEVQKVLEKIGVVSKDDFEALQARVDELEKKLGS